MDLRKYKTQKLPLLKEGGIYSYSAGESHMMIFLVKGHFMKHVVSNFISSSEVCIKYANGNSENIDSSVTEINFNSKVKHIHFIGMLDY